VAIPWFGPELGPEERDAVALVMESTYLNDGEVTLAFERAVAARLGVPYAVGVTNGTAAIALSLMAAGIGPGDEVLVPDLTFIATANAVQLAAASVKLVDIDPVTLAISVEAARQSIGKTTRAIVPVDVNGRGADYDALHKLCAEHGLVLISDSCEGLGSRYRGRPLGTFGLAGCLSFSPNKIVTCGQGGMVVTNEASLHDRLRELKDQGRRQPGSGGDDLHPVLGFNFKLTNLQSAIGLVQLKRLDERLEHACRIRRLYREGLDGLPGVTLLPDDVEGGTILQWSDVLIADRARACDAFDAARIGYRRFWYPLHTQGPYAAAGAAFPNSRRASARGLWLPSHYSLKDSDVERVSEVLRAALRA
jgi:perosamine synthetase